MSELHTKLVTQRFTSVLHAHMKKTNQTIPKNEELLRHFGTTMVSQQNYTVEELVCI